MIAKRSEEFADERERTSEVNAAKVWDSFKQKIREELTSLKKAARKRMNSGYRQSVQRLKKKIKASNAATEREEIERLGWVSQLQTIQAQHRVMKRRSLQNKGAWSSKASSKFFFSRICTKFGDNTIPTLKQQEGAPARPEHAKSDILADGWETILNGVVEDKDSMRTFVH
ncbi:hypothetical protein PI124_g13641 [Phytophthora idaei]|nr:hypothetical protein PI125_g19403 [Phytophthora idaei]KAG3161759.1 hypothetical protein PI126_g6302 [Phytophthora idaei]KAG3241497.1 hypothetical protein PI124_g13641 [Phytophthora idaei]